MNHNIKIHPIHFDKICIDKKFFEIRFNDRDFKVGDTCTLQEYYNQNRKYTGWELPIIITYVLSDFEGLAKGWCAFSFTVTGSKSYNINN
jgi:ParB family transcriptional regulator, chromosome partitioning protein